MLGKHSHVAAHIKKQGRIGDLLEQRWVGIAFVSDNSILSLGRRLDLDLGLLHPCSSRDGLGHLRGEAAAFKLGERGVVDPRWRPESLHQPMDAPHTQSFDAPQGQPVLGILQSLTHLFRDALAQAARWPFC